MSECIKRISVITSETLYIFQVCFLCYDQFGFCGKMYVGKCTDLKGVRECGRMLCNSLAGVFRCIQKGKCVVYVFLKKSVINYLKKTMFGSVQIIPHFNDMR